MTDAELKDRANIYAELIKHPGWAVLIHDGNNAITNITAAIMNTSGDTCDKDKGIVSGINLILSWPTDIISEAVKKAEKENESQSV